MRTIIAAAIGIVVGVIIGGFPSAMRLSNSEAKVAELQDRDCAGSPFAGAVAGLLERGADRPTAPVDDIDTDLNGDLPADPAAPADGNGVHVQFGDAPPNGEKSALEGLDSVDAVRTALDVRRTQARAALIEDADPSEEQLAAIDEAMSTMSGELGALTEELTAQLNEGGEPSRRDSMVFAAEALDVLINAEDRMAGILTEEQRAAADPESLDPLSWLDPALAEQLANLQPPEPE